MGLRLADALSYAHQRGVLHLDVKPGNILISPYGRPLLTDFNISINRQAQEENRPRLFGGTLNYMAPEHLKVFKSAGAKPRCEPSEIDQRADIYSLGVVLREMFDRTDTLIPGAPGTAEIGKILRKATAAEPDARYQTAAELARALEGCLELFKIAKALPPLGRLLRFTERHPFRATFALVVLPNLIGSVVNISYNQIRIVSHLTASQQQLFYQLVMIYNSVVYPLCMAYLIRQLLPLRGCLSSPQWLCDMPNEGLRKLRRHVLRLPFRAVGSITLGWMPGALFFPLAIRLLDGPVGGPVFLPFLISFTLSWLIALTYAYLYLQFVVLRLYYPRLWPGQSELRRAAAEELARNGPSLRTFHLMAGFVPLTGAALVVLVGPDNLDPSSYQTYRFLVALLIGLGMLGLVSALHAANFLAQTLFALTGSERGGASE
jgi:hypothetical protein